MYSKRGKWGKGPNTTHREIQEFVEKAIPFDRRAASIFNAAPGEAITDPIFYEVLVCNSHTSVGQMRDQADDWVLNPPEIYSDDSEH